MKKFSMFLKRTLFVVLPALFACSLSIGQLHDVKPVSAEDNSTIDYDVDNEMYTLKKTGEHSLELLFNADPKVYKNFRKSNLDELIDAVKEILKDIVHTKIIELSEVQTDVDTSAVDGQGGEEDDRDSSYVGPLIPGMPEMVYDATTYVSLDTYREMILDYTYNEEEDKHDLYMVSQTVVVGYAHYYVQEYIERNGLTNDVATRTNVFNDFCCLLGNSPLSSRFDATPREVYSQFYGAGESILPDGFKINLDNVTAVLLLIKHDDSGTNDTGVRDLLATIGGQKAKDSILALVQNSSRSELKNFFVNVPTIVIQALLREIDFTGTDLNNVMENIGVQTFIDITGEIGVTKTREIIQYVNEFDTNDFIEKVTALTTAGDVWSAIKNIYVDGIHVVKDKQFLIDGLGELLSTIMSPDKLRHLEDSKWRHEFKVVLDTAVEEVKLDATIGFKGDCKYLRKLAAIIDDHVKAEVVDGKYIIKVDFPDFLANMYRYVIEADILNDDLKHELFDLAFSSVEEAYQHVHSKTIEDLKLNAEQIDYHQLAESILSADEIKEFFGISKFVTQERVDKFVDLLFKAINKGATLDIQKVYDLVDEFYQIPDDLKDSINKIYDKAQSLLEKIARRDYNSQDLHDLLSEYTSEEFNNRVNDKIDSYLENAKVQKYYSRFQRLLEKVYNHVPERFRHRTLMEFYRGESVWSGEGTVDFNIQKLVRRIPKIGAKIADFLSAFFDKLPDTLSLDLTFKAADLYRVSYHVGDEVKTGALPTDVDGQFFANRKTVYDGTKVHDIVGWYETFNETNQYFYLMPSHDVDAYPIYFESSADVKKEYDGLETTIEVTPNVELNHEYSFVWYKNGQILYDETSNSITVKNHSDSGTYYCVVDGVKQEEIVVKIDRVVVDSPTQTEEVIYDGLEHDYYTTFGATSEDELLFHGTGDVKQTEPGDYVVNLELNDPDNYEWSASSSTTYSWSIQKKVIIVHDEQIIWDYQGPFTYDGTEKSVHIYEDQLPDGVHAVYENNVKTNAGTYKAEVHIVLDDPEHYILQGVQYKDKSWVIEKAQIVIPPEVGLIQNSFEYDGQAHTVQIDPTYLPEEITGVLYSGTQTETNIGEYSVHVTYNFDRTNYTIDNTYQKYFTWQINPHLIDVTNVTWDYTNPFTKDGLKHSVKLVGVPTGVKVEYTGTVSATEAGTYIAYARMYTNVGSMLVYNGERRDSVELTLTWQIAEGTPIPTRNEFYSVEQNEAGTSLAWISLSTGIQGDYTLRAEEVDYSKYNFNSIVKTGHVEVVTVYDINFYDENHNIAHINVDASGKVIDPNFVFTLRILVPDSYKDHELVLTYVNDNGEVTRLDGERQGNYMVYKTNHLSIYGLVETHVAGSDLNPYIIVGLAVALNLQVTAGWLMITLSKRKRRLVKE